MTNERKVIAVLTLPGSERSVAYARRFARDTFGTGHPSLGDIETCVSKAFTNGVAHTASGRGGKVTVAFLAVADEIVTEVTDDGAGGARPRLRHDLMGVHGRGRTSSQRTWRATRSFTPNDPSRSQSAPDAW